MQVERSDSGMLEELEGQYSETEIWCMSPFARVKARTELYIPSATRPNAIYGRAALDHTRSAARQVWCGMTMNSKELCF